METDAIVYYSIMLQMLYTYLYIHNNSFVNIIAALEWSNYMHYIHVLIMAYYIMYVFLKIELIKVLLLNVR